ncbi:MAG: PleD family two-component system response regulator [Pseudomonadota bacterium]|nr:PleD family two-component system response regulator [Pseudomonadota bacterium]
MSARVLVVDDVAPNVRILEAKLSSEYYQVSTASSGPEALAQVERENPDIILLDVMMPGMDGFEVCRRLKANPAVSHIPVVMVTALSDVSDRVQGLEAGADDFLTKPVNDLALFSRVRSLVRLKMTMDELKLRREAGERFGMAVNAAEMTAEGAYVLAIVENGSDIRQVRRHMDPRFDVRFEADGAAALDSMRTRTPDLVVLSLDHRGLDALRLTAAIRNIEGARHTPIMIIGEETDSERVAKALELGVTDYILRPIDGNEIIARATTQIRRKRYQDKLRESVETSIAMAMSDPLTGLYNRRYLDQHLDMAIDRNRKAGKPLSVVMLDIDHFKRVNDTYGHAAGDRVLQQFSERIQRNIRGFDLAARMGGEEFLVVLPEADAALAQRVGERLRAAMQQEPFETGEAVGKIDVTCSIGAAALGVDDDRMSLIKRADAALYAAKSGGRNQVVLAA